MKSLILSLSTLFLFVLSVEFASAQTAATTCKPEDCAKVCCTDKNCTPDQCAKMCADKPNCKPGNCQKTGTKTSSAAIGEANPAILVNNKKESPKSSCCSKAAACSATKPSDSKSGQ